MNDFIDLFMIWNARINLSAARTRDEVKEHIEDSKHIVALLSGRVLDVGAGGGFPVIIAAHERPDLQLVALEPNHKKHAFLREAIRTLNLQNLDARCERLEVHPNCNYNTAMSRATFDLGSWFELARAHVVEGGRVLGFEALPRLDLPKEIVRHTYRVGGKSRAIVELRV
jgi:16S rRNA (guanine527-N7)-methyltransferase